MHTLGDFATGKASILQWEGEIAKHRHGVVQNRKLKDLGNVAFFRRQPGDVLTVIKHPAATGGKQTGNDVQ